MPTPVNTAKQCLNTEASHALDKAVLVTRRRGHAQTTSLHAVYAFLSLSPSQLREACVRAKNAAFYPKVQLKALDFCLSVSLDRLPISQPSVDEPKISNSLMAAIKRSQANQRRHPDSLMTVKNHQEQLGSCSSGVVKVELPHLIISILDDPIVSRVFSDAGFCSFDVKLALLRPLQGYFRYPPSVFGGFSEPGSCRFRFPFSGFGDEEGDYRRIGEVLVRHKGRNPLLVGVCANDVLKGFVEVLEKRRESGYLPLEIHGIKVVSIEKDVSKIVTESWSYEAVNLRFREMDLMVQQCLGPGLMVSFGNVKCFLGGNNEYVKDVINSVVKRLTKLLEVHDTKIWLIGSAANDQMCMEFLRRFPSIDKDWDLQPLPITSVRPPVGESCFKSSLMGSFVPLGGFFSSPEVKGPFGSSYQCVTPCSMSNEKIVEEISSRGCMTLMADKCGSNDTLDNIKAKGGKVLLSAPVAVLQKKHCNLCQCQNHTQPSSKPEVCQESSQLPTDVGFHSPDEKVIKVDNESSCTTSGSCKECDYGQINSCTSMDVQKHSLSSSSKSVLLRSLKSGIFPTKLSESPPRTGHPVDVGSSPYSFCISGVDDGQTSPSSVVSVATDLGLGLFPQASKQQKKADERPENNSKALFKTLFERVGRQCEALRMISQIVSHSWTVSGSHQKSGIRGDIWLNFSGPDIFAKRKTAVALAEILYGSKKSFIHVDLSSRDMIFCQGSEARSRGKTIVDYIAEELRKTPSCVVLFENVHSADPVLQCSLLQAMKDGKFSDSYGREVATNNRIFVLTSISKEKSSTLPLRGKPSNFPEERIGRAKGWPLQIVVKGISHETGDKLACETFLNKRKLNGTDVKTDQFICMEVKRPHRRSIMSLDLNLPAETSEVNDTNIEENDAAGCLSERSDSWLEDFSGQLSKILVKLEFNPFDYDTLATKISKMIHASFNEVIKSKCLLEIEPKVMDQIIAAACLCDSDKEVEDWIGRVLSKGFVEAQSRYQPTGHSIVMIAACEVLYVEQQVQEACLPSKIILT
ncbi:protein SMAX1-LIKE 8-like [Chenopodium quinoa]|uniref:protein SMAX1-LIKE 8-like n=1 Tax=Chenopodium quinoa TaxID=63459 RepID=UPI000B7837E7|nr:protein SMAX1-LIKE 8-like [Chenopodium quinoa]